MRQLIAPLVSLLILAVLWWQVDMQALWRAAQATDTRWLAAGILGLAPLVLAAALRFRLLSRTRISYAVAVRLTLSAATLNLFLPSKLGDLAKGWLLVRRHGFRPELALAIVVLERLLDLAALIAWGLAALLWIGADTPALLLLTLALAGLLALLVLLILPLAFSARLLTFLGGRLPGKLGSAVLSFAASWHEVLQWFWSAPRRAVGTLLFSLALWGGHLVQFWLLARAVGYVPLADSMAFATLAILAGLLPFTIAGIGTRDAAIVFFYHAWLTPGQGAVLGVLASLRYVIPAIVGLLFVRDFWAAARMREEME